MNTYIDDPVSNSFIDFRKLTQVYRSRTPGNNAAHPDSLALNVVEYALFQKIGVKITFVNNIVDHLDFDITTKELSILAWPSFFRVNLADGAGNRTGVPLANLYDTALCHFCRYALDFQVLTLRLFTCRLAKGLRASASEPTIFEEVILSMRLLFSRSKESRKIFRERVGQEEQPVDPFLGGCVSPINARNAQRAFRSHLLPVFHRHPEPMQYFNNTDFKDYALDPARWDRLRDRKTCSAAAEFPVFADRLRALQAFINSQPLDGFRELVGDRVEMTKFRVSLAVVAISAIGVLVTIITSKFSK